MQHTMPATSHPRGTDPQDLLPRDEPVRLSYETGAEHADSDYPMPADDVLQRAYRGLVGGRRINDQANALVRQGRLAVYPSSVSYTHLDVYKRQIKTRVNSGPISPSDP